MFLIKVFILAIIQGLAELLPVSSSAHVIVAEKLMGLDPTTPNMMVVLVMLHTGTMFAVIVYFWKAWKASIFPSTDVFKQQAIKLVLATALTALIGGPLILGIQIITHDKIEKLAGKLPFVSAALAAAGALILVAGMSEKTSSSKRALGLFEAAWIGAIQGLSLPFRGFSRSGATISVGMVLGCVKTKVEEFSFALAVIITPVIVAKEVYDLKKEHPEAIGLKALAGLLGPSMVGMVAAFLAGLVALRWLSGWLEHGRWYLFGIYCMVAASVVAGLAFSGY